MTARPVGDPVSFDGTVRPVRQVLAGRYARLEPVSSADHAAPLFAAASRPGGEQTWRYLAYGPFADAAEFGGRLETCAVSEDPLFFTIVDPDAGGPAGLASFLRFEPAMGVIEIGHIWMSPPLQRSRAATEAIFLMMDHALGTLGYRRLEWKCDALNAASRQAALRHGFTYEGTFRQHMIVKGRNRDTAWFSLLGHEWPELRRRFMAWLDPENFDAGGRQRMRLQDAGQCNVLSD